MEPAELEDGPPATGQVGIVIGEGGQWLIQAVPSGPIGVSSVPTDTDDGSSLNPSTLAHAAHAGIMGAPGAAAGVTEGTLDDAFVHGEERHLDGGRAAHTARGTPAQHCGFG